MKSKIKTIITLSFLFAIVFANAQISKTTADNMVLHTIVNDTTKVVYTMDNSIGNDLSIITANGEKLINPYDISYIYFIDDIPAANWEHPCRYCFINERDGAYTIEYNTIYPDNYKSFNRIGERVIENRWQWPYTNYTIPAPAAPNNKLYAVLIAGDIGPNGCDKKAWYNLSCVYTTLVSKYGFMEDNDMSHIYVYKQRC